MTKESKNKTLLEKISALFNRPQLTNIYILILFTLLISLVMFKTVAGFSPVLYSDNAIYAHLTWFFTQGQFDKAVHIWWQPLLPFLGSLLNIYFNDIPLSLFYVSVISGTLLFTPIFLISYELTKNRAVSVLAGLLATFHLQLIKSFYTLLTENLFITLLMTSVLFATYTLSRKRLIYAFIYGLVVGVTYIARSDVLLSYQIFLLFGLLLVIFRQLPKSFYFKILALSLVAFFIAISPYLYFNNKKFGFINLGAKFNAVKNMPAYFSPQRDLTTTYAQDVWVLEDPNYDSDFFNKPFPYWRYRIELWESSIQRGQGYIRLFFEHENTTIIYLSLIAFAVSLLYFFRYARAGLYLNLFAVLGFLGSLPFQPGVDFRYSFWLYPLFSIFTAVFLLALNKTILKIKVRQYLQIIVLIILNLTFLGFYFNVYKENLTPPPQPDKGLNRSIHQQVGEYIHNLKPNAKIMTRREAITYYAKGSIVYIPSSIDINDLESYARRYKVDYIVADRDTFPPDTLLKNLNDENDVPGWLNPVKIWTTGYPKTIIYEVKF